MINVVCYYSQKDKDLQSTRDLLTGIQTEFPHKYIEVCVDEDENVYQGYTGRTPVLEIGPYHLFTPFTLADIKMTIGAARDRQASLEKSEDPKYMQRVERGSNVTGSDRFSLWLTRHYMIIFNFLMLVFVGLPFAAPVFEEVGWTIPAKVIYAVYSPLCHQFGFRSWFLYGEQAAYPRELAGQSGITFEQATGIDPRNVLEAKAFIGNNKLGYKVAICERDVAIYGGILLFGLIFAVSGRKIRSIPWYIWVIVGIIPMGIDGASQLPALLTLKLSFLPIRESTPFLRTLTGLLFGVTTAWYGYPMI
jgi:uncharacterized membrane protein